MAAKQMPPPKIYMFSEDQKGIKQLTDKHKDGSETSGDLFGLWTNDDELVIHLVTGQAGSKGTRKALKKKFCLPRIGKWQYVTGSTQNRSDMAQTMRDDKGLFKEGIQSVLLITVARRERSECQMSPFLVSKTSVSAEGKIDTLQGENVFSKLDEMKMIIDAFLMTSKENESEGEISKDTPTVSKGEGRDNATTEDDSFKKAVGERYEALLSFPPEHLRDDFRVNMFQEDTDMMGNLVLTYPTVETGGDLFGLWTSEGEAVIHVVLGPGRDCRRTDVSFHQDIPYLQRNGELLTDKYMLCHIGEWHSHHQLRLFQPSQGDSSTVIRNYPSGVQGFILIIANIIAPGQVQLSPYLYTQSSRYTYDKKGGILSLRVDNPFRKMADIQGTMTRGMETEEDVRQKKLLLHEQYSSSGGKRHSRRNQSPARANAKKHHNTNAEPMEWSSYC